MQGILYLDNGCCYIEQTGQHSSKGYARCSIQVNAVLGILYLDSVCCYIEYSRLVGIVGLCKVCNTGKCSTRYSLSR